MPQELSNSNLHSCMNLIFIVCKAQNLCTHGIKAVCVIRYSTTCFNMLVISIATTRDIQLRKIFIRRVYEQTLLGKQSISFIATNIWKDLPTYFKKLKFVCISKEIIHYLLSEQQMKYATCIASRFWLGTQRNKGV